MTLQEIRSKNFKRKEENPYNFPPYDRSISKVVNECTHKHNPIKGKPIAYGDRIDHDTRCKKGSPAKAKIYFVKGIGEVRGLKGLSKVIRMQYKTVEYYAQRIQEKKGKYYKFENSLGHKLQIKLIK